MTDQKMQPQKDAAFCFNVLMELEAVLTRDQAFDVTCHDFLQQLMGTFLVPKGALLLLDPVENLLYLKTGSGLSFERIEIRMDRETFHNLLALDSPISRLSDPPEALTAFFQSKKRMLQSLEAELWVTLRLKNSVVGALLLCPKWQAAAFDEMDLKILHIAANMLASSIHNHTLLEHLRNSNEDEISRSRVSEMRDALSIAPQNFLTIKALTDEILRQALKILGSISGAVFLTQPHNPLLKISSAIGVSSSNLQSFHLSKNLKLFTRSFQRTVPVIIETKDDRKLQQLFGDRDLIMGPLVIRDEPVGAIILSGKSNENGEVAFDEDDIKALDTISRQAGFAIDNFLRFQGLKAENRRLKDIHDRMSGGLIELNQIGEVVEANAAFIALSEKSREELIGLHYNILFNRESAVLNLIQQVLSSGRPAMEQSVVLRSFSDSPVLNISASAIENEENVVRGIVLTLDKLPQDAQTKALFRDKVDPASLSEIIYGPHQPDLDGETLRVTVVVMRVSNLADLYKKVSPLQLSVLVNQLSAKIRESVFAEAGSIDRNDPSETICLFGWPLVRGNPAAHAINSYRKVLETVTDLIVEGQEVRLSAGISGGHIVAAGGKQVNAGNLFIFGEAIQTARHLCLQAGGGKCLVSDNIYQELQESYSFTRQKKSRIKGWTGSTQTWLLR